MTETERRCGYCGDRYHQEPDTEGWMGLICPGASATEEEAEAFSTRLCEAYAAHVAAEFTELHAQLAERRRLWYARVRTHVSPAELQADADVRTTAEITRQLRDEVWQPESFEIDLPPHLTVPGGVPDRPTVVRPGEDPENADLYVDPE